MSDIVWIKKINDVHLYVYCEPSVAKELSTYFTFEVPGAKFMPTVRNRMWDGKIRLFNLRNNSIYVGLLPYIKEWLSLNGITYTIDDNLKFVLSKQSVLILISIKAHGLIGQNYIFSIRKDRCFYAKF